MRRRKASLGRSSKCSMRGRVRNRCAPRLVSAAHERQVPELSLADISPELAVARSGKDWKDLLRVNVSGLGDKKRPRLLQKETALGPTFRSTVMGGC